MSRTKYLMSGGLAFSEQKDMEKLSKLSSEGWHVRKFSFLGYTLEQDLFRAALGTMPIYTDRETTTEKYKNQVKPLNLAMMALVPGTIISWMISLISTGSIHTLFFSLALLLTVLTIPLLWTALTSYGNQWKAENKNGLVILTKLLPAVAVVVAFFAIMESDLKAVQIAAAAVIGATVFVTFITLFMSLYHRIKVKKA